MVSPGEVEATRGIWGTAIARLYESAQEWALVQLRQDIVNPDLATVPDGYIYRANAVCLGLMGAGQYEMAERIYDNLIKQVDAYHESGGQRKHRGALIANQAVCHILSGKFDLGIPRLLFTAIDEDWQTYGVPEPSSHAMTILTSQFEEPSVELIRMWCEGPMWPAKGGRLQTHQVRETAELLGPGRWSVYAVMRRTQEVWATHLRYPSAYAAPRLLDGLRGVCVALEDSAKRIGRNSTDATTQKKFAVPGTLTLKPSLDRLFAPSASVWWSELETIVKRGLTKFAFTTAAADFRDNLASLLALPDSTTDELITKSLAVALLCRNYSAHELQPPPDFADTNALLPPFVGAFSYTLVALLMLVEASTLCGHIVGATSTS